MWIKLRSLFQRTPKYTGPWFDEKAVAGCRDSTEILEQINQASLDRQYDFIVLRMNFRLRELVGEMAYDLLLDWASDESKQVENFEACLQRVGNYAQGYNEQFLEKAIALINHPDTRPALADVILYALCDTELYFRPEQLWRKLEKFLRELTHLEIYTHNTQQQIGICKERIARRKNACERFQTGDLEIDLDYLETIYNGGSDESKPFQDAGVTSEQLLEVVLRALNSRDRSLLDQDTLPYKYESIEFVPILETGQTLQVHVVWERYSDQKAKLQRIWEGQYQEHDMKTVLTLENVLGKEKFNF